MSLDAHLDLLKGNIKGESKHDGHVDHIQLLSYSFGCANTGSHAQGTGGGTGKASVHDFHFTMHMSKASPLLFLASVTGQHIPEATLVVRKAGQVGGQQKFLIVKFHDLMISSYQTGGHDAHDGLPVEQITFNYSKIEIEYHGQDAAGKTSKGHGAAAGFCVKTNKKV